MKSGRGASDRLRASGVSTRLLFAQIVDEIHQPARARRKVRGFVALVIALVTIDAVAVAIARLIAVLLARLAVALTRLTTLPAMLVAVLAEVALRTALLLLGREFALRLGEHPRVVLGMLHEVLGRHAVVGQLGITREDLVFLDDLLRRAAHLALGAGAVEHPVDDVSHRPRAVRLRART